MNSRKSSSSGLVYSTEHGRMCPACRHPVSQCVCRNSSATPPKDGIVRVRLETKGRRGKGVTVISGVPLSTIELDAFGKLLKQRCGSGGTVKDGTIEVQGDHVTTVMDELSKKGWTVRRSGG